MRLRVKAHCAGAVVGAMLFFAGSAHSQTASNVPFTVSDARPLAKAAEIIEVKYGLLINYEDPAYVHADDVRDDTDLKYKQQDPSARALSVRGGQLVFDVEARADGRGLANPMRALQTVVDAHNSRGLPGSFRVLQTKDTFSIVPVAVKDRSGRVGSFSSPLDAKMSIPEREVTGTQLVELICEEVTRASGFRVVPGLLPSNVLNNTTVVLKATNEVAREVLLRALPGLSWKQPGITIPPRKLVWQLFYAPGPEMYFLHLHVAMKEVPARFFARTIQVPQ